ncbi:MAG: hypothetical protein AAGI91_12645 [Bacteroidota bacterium]
MTRLLPLLFLWVAALPVAAQSATDYYHTAAQLYIGEQNAGAEAAAEAGLALDPADAKLQALLEKIRERQQEQGGGGDEQEAENADEQQPGEGAQQSDAEAETGEDPQNESEQEGEQQQPGDEQESGEQPLPPEDQPAPDEREADAGSEGEVEADPQAGDGTGTPFEVKPGEMSREEAERILRAIQTDELELLRDVQRRRARPRYVEKDW